MLLQGAVTSENLETGEVLVVKETCHRSSITKENPKTTFQQISSCQHVIAPDSAILLNPGPIDKDLRRDVMEVKERFGLFFEEYKGTSRLTASFFLIELLHKLFVAMSIGVVAGTNFMSL